MIKQENFIVDEHVQFIEKLYNLSSIVNSIKEELFNRERKTKNTDERIKVFENIQNIFYASFQLENLSFDVKNRYEQNRMNKSISEINKKQSELNKNTIQLKEQFEEIKREIQKLKSDAESQIFKAEKKVFNNSMTYMSILAALIAIIVSVVSTNSTWLSNANENSIVFAFVVPTSVLLVAIISLLSFSGYLFSEEKGKKLILLGLFAFTVFIVILTLICFFLKII